MMIIRNKDTFQLQEIITDCSLNFIFCWSPYIDK